MTDHKPSLWLRLRDWLLHNLMFSGEWSLLPVHKDDIPGTWVPMDSPEYQTLIHFGYPHPEGQEVDWDLEHDLEPAELVELFRTALRSVPGRGVGDG